MAKLGFLGLGIMGYPMAHHLIGAGHSVALWSHTASKAKKLAAQGGGLFCETPAAVAEHADVMFLCVGDSEMSAQLILGPNGLASKAKKGAVIADCSTIAPSLCRKIHGVLAKQGVHYLDTPCTGSRPGAEAGTLTFMIGGEQEVFEKVRMYFEPMGKRLYYCGGTSMGLHAKLTQNLILSNILNAFNEGMVLATKAGVDPELMLEVLDNSAAKSGLISFKAPYVFRRDFAPNFSVKWMHKDIGLMMDSANEMNVPLPLTAQTQQMFRTAIAAGLGEEDICGTIRVLEGLAGVEVKKREGQG